MDTGRKLELFQRGLDCFNQRHFFECHEVLEEIWLEESEEEKPFYQGLIQLAAAFHHFQKGNLRGALSLLRAGADKLRRYPPHYHGINLATLLAALAPWLDHLERQQPLDNLTVPTILLAN